MASVALAGPPRVNDKLQSRVQTCPTVYKSATLVEVAPRAFFCQTPDASLDHGVGLSRDISHPATHHFAKCNGFRESFFNTQCLVCFSGRVLEISFASSCLVSLNGGVISKVYIAPFLARGTLIGARRAARQILSAELPLHLWLTRIPGRQLGLSHPGLQLQQAVTQSLA
jgi:hypothetical protein